MVRLGARDAPLRVHRHQVEAGEVGARVRGKGDAVEVGVARGRRQRDLR